MVMFTIHLLPFIVFITSYNIANSEICKETLNQHFGTKSAYKFVQNENYTKHNYNGCAPGKIWMLVRHGTRNPSQEVIEAMQTRLPQIKELILNGDDVKLRNADFKSLKKWKPKKMRKEEEKFLTPEGGEEMVAISERMQARFPDILQGVYSNTSYKFKHTDTERAKASAKYFAIGLFGKKTAKDVWFPAPEAKDPILRFYKACTKWHKQVKKNPETMVELEKFKASGLVLQSIRDIERKLGIKVNALTFDDVQIMYTTCAFEYAWNRRKGSPWCAAFDLNTIKIFEYADDLKHYWLDGYGYNITYRQACATFKDMIDLHEDKERFPRAVLYFTHSGTLLKVLSHLGLYKDKKPLMHDNMDEQRQWRTSRIDAFATNLAFVSFNCSDQIKLLLLHQETTVRFPCCPDEDLCPLSKVKEFYKESISDCNVQEICEL